MQWRIPSIVFLLVCAFWNTEQLQSEEAATSAEGTRYEHRLEMSRFDLGAGVHQEDGRLIGDKGVFFFDKVTGATLAVPNSPAAPKPPAPQSGTPASNESQLFTYPRPLTENPDEHSAAVRAYLVGAGVPEAEVSGMHVTTTMAGGGPIRDGVQPSRSRLLWYTTHLERSLGGIPVEGSYAFAALDSDRRVITEGVYWPAIPARIVSRARALKRKLASANEPERSTFLSAVRRARPEVENAEGTVTIVHTSAGYHGEFQALALYSVVVRSTTGGKAQILRFDDAGVPVRMVDEVPSGIDSVKQQ
jgi:hypothetical protein